MGVLLDGAPNGVQLAEGDGEDHGVSQDRVLDE